MPTLKKDVRVRTWEQMEDMLCDNVKSEFKWMREKKNMAWS